MFWNKNENKESSEKSDDESLKELKEQIEAKRSEVSEKPERPKFSGREKKPEPKQKEKREVPSKKPFEPRVPKRGELKPTSAPLFIKIDRYREVIQQLEEIRKTLGTIKNLLNLLANVDELKGETMNTFKDAISEVTDSLISLDEQFIRPEGVEEIVPEPETQTEVESYMTDLRSELKDLRKKLNKIE